MRTEPNGCIEFPYFGARYPDATCIEGALHDLDDCDENGRLYLKDEYHPCPSCNKEEFKKYHELTEEEFKKYYTPIVAKWG